MGRAWIAVVLGGLHSPIVRAEEPADATAHVVVPGTRVAPPLSNRDATAASTVVRSDELSSAGANSTDVLARVPGVQVTRTGSAAQPATASLRGATSAQTPVYLAGVRINDDVTGTADLSTLPPWMLDRVEIFRGNAPAEADSLGIGGAVFFEPKLPSRSEVGAGSEVGSFGALSTWASGAGAGEATNVAISLRRSSADDDFTFPVGRAADGTEAVETRRNADHETYDGWIIGRHRLGRGARATTLLHGLSRERGAAGLAVPTGGEGSTRILQTDRARTTLRRLLAAVRTRVPCAHGVDGTETCHLELDTTMLTSRQIVDDPLRELSTTTAVLTESSGERLQQGVRATLHATDAVRVDLGATQSVELLGIDQDDAAAMRARRATTRPSASVAWEAADRLTLHGIAALECHSTRAAGSGDACGVLEPAGRVGLRLELPRRIELRSNVGRYVRVPTLGELFGVSAVVLGNSDLSAETGLSADLGGRWTTAPAGAPMAYVDLFGFARLSDALVKYQQNAQGVIRPFNAESARTLGVELASGFDLGQWVRAEVSASGLDPRDTSANRTLENDILPFRSRLVVSSELELYVEPSRRRASLDRAGVTTRLLHRSSKFADDAGLVVIDDQTVVDVEAAMHFFDRRLGVLLASRNLFDARQLDNVGMPLPGRSFHGALEAWWR